MACKSIFCAMRQQSKSGKKKEKKSLVLFKSMRGVESDQSFANVCLVLYYFLQLWFKKF